MLQLDAVYIREMRTVHNIPLKFGKNIRNKFPLPCVMVTRRIVEHHGSSNVTHNILHHRAMVIQFTYSFDGATIVPVTYK